MPFFWSRPLLPHTHIKKMTEVDIRETDTHGKGTFVCDNPVLEGAVVLRERPLVYAASGEGSYCHSCLQAVDPDDAIQCPRCACVQYCNRDCLAADWGQFHQHECALFSTVETVQVIRDSTGGRFFLRCLLLRAFQPTKYLRLQALHKGPGEWLMNPYLEVTKSLGLAMHLVFFRADSDREKDKQLVMRATHSYGHALISIAVANVFSIKDGDQPASGLCLYDRASRINHSCRPNCSWRIENASIVICAAAGRTLAVDEEVTISYLATEETWGARQLSLFKSYDFVCMCSECVDQCPPPLAPERLVVESLIDGLTRTHRHTGPDRERVFKS